MPSFAYLKFLFGKYVIENVQAAGFHISLLTFTNCMSGMHNRNLLYAGKLDIVTSSPPPSQRMDLSPPRSFRWAFFLRYFLSPKKKPAIDTDAGSPCLLASHLLGVDFVADHEAKYHACLLALHYIEQAMIRKKAHCGDCSGRRPALKPGLRFCRPSSTPRGKESAAVDRTKDLQKCLDDATIVTCAQ